MRRFSAAACLLLVSVAAQAGSADDLAAAKSAVEKSSRDEAIRLFTRALAAGDLKPEDQVAALRGRGGEYTAKSLISDAFNRNDEGRRLRDNAIADFGAALKLKTDDAGLFAARGQVEHMAGQYDQAIADFDASLKLKASTLTMTQSAASARAKGDYDRALADYAAALAAPAKDEGFDEFDLVTERGFTNFLAARYDVAADDFIKAIALGSAERATDVLWLGYQAAWLHLSRARAGKNDEQELKANAGRIDLKQWPGTLVAYFMGDIKFQDVAATSNHGTMGRGRDCGLSFFAGEKALAKGDKDAATPLFQRAKEICNIHTIYSLGAGVELKRLGKQG